MGIGEIGFRVRQVIRRVDGGVSTPVLEALEVRRRRYLRDVRMKVVEFASKVSCRDAGLEFEMATGVHVPERTIHGFVKEVAPPLLEAGRMDGRSGMVMGDATKVRGLKRREIKRVHVLLSDGGRLLHLGVNGGWPSTEVEVLISDNEPGLTNAVKADRRRFCILHALKHLLFTLWGEGI